MTCKIIITKNKINCDIITSIFKNEHGAHSIFIGTIKNKNNKKKVKYIKYTVFKNLFKKTFLQKNAFLKKEKKSIDILIIQAEGKVNVGEINSIIAASGKNRKDAFYVCKILVETLKYDAPVWKKEFYSDNSSSWINA